MPRRPLLLLAMTLAAVLAMACFAGWGQQEAVLGRELLQKAVPCSDVPQRRAVLRRGGAWVVRHAAPRRRRFACWESLTLVTHATAAFLANLPPLLERWRAPVSLALYAPREDFPSARAAMRYARACVPRVADLVAFHLVFPAGHVPVGVLRTLAEDERTLGGVDCSRRPPWERHERLQLYKKRSNMTYPVNVCRNVARDAAPTHFVLVSDIELYPSPLLAPRFLAMVLRHAAGGVDFRTARRVYTLPLFEVEETAQVPNSKKELVQMLKNETAVPFHEFVCKRCHDFPDQDAWPAVGLERDLDVFRVAERVGVLAHWEPVFIGTRRDPPYDDRLTWEGKSDKMTQGYAMCVLGYEFHVLDSAFLVHRPGIKRVRKDPARQVHVDRSSFLINTVIKPELEERYGTRPGCVL